MATISTLFGPKIPTTTLGEFDSALHISTSVPVLNTVPQTTITPIKIEISTTSLGSFLPTWVQTSDSSTFSGGASSPTQTWYMS